MKEFEISYYLDRRQLLLLLSLIDQRPVAGIPPVGEPEDWKSVSLSLLEDGRLRYENGRLVMEEGLAGLLLTMKDAERVYAIHGKRPEPLNCVMYQGGPPAFLELLGDGRVRLSQTDVSRFTELAGAALMPGSPMPEALLTVLPDDELLQECLTRWRAVQVSPEDAFIRWMELEEVRGVLECLSPEACTRLIWVEDVAATLLAVQSREETQVELDTASRRRSLLREMGLEA